MRINVYDEEMTNEVIFVVKTADTGKTFYGCRIFLKGSDDLHHAPDDDDRTAITFWSDNYRRVSKFVDNISDAMVD